MNIEPTSIFFEAVEPGTLYVMTFSVRNVSSVSERIRLISPKSSIFAVNYIPAASIAPGLDLRAEIECLIPQELPGHVFLDKIVAVMGNHRIELCVKAEKPKMSLSYMSFLDFGSFQRSQPMTKEVWFENKSTLQGSIRFVPPKSSSLKLSTGKMDFEPFGSPGCRSLLKITLESKDTGIFRDFVRFLDTSTSEEFCIEIVAQIIQAELLVLSSDKKGVLENANFGDIFFGDNRTMTALLVNSGPHSLSYSIRFEDEEDNTQTENSAEKVKSLSISPVDGVVKPFSEIALTATFCPSFENPAKGFKAAFMKDLSKPLFQRRVAFIECLDSSQNITLGLEGTAILPSVSVIPSLLRFGECPVSDRRDILLTVSNNCLLPVDFLFPTLANFKFYPTKGKILSGENISVVASFLPSQLGDFKTSGKVTIQNGLQLLELKLVGEAFLTDLKKTVIGGVEKLPKDFAVEHKFVNPEEEAAARLEKNVGKSTALGSSGKILEPSAPFLNPSSESDEIYGTVKQTKLDKDPKEDFKLQMQQFYKDHNSHYNRYLQDSALRRELDNTVRKRTKLLKRGAVDFSDPFGVNLGMERGLLEPVLRIPQAVEGLVLSGSLSGADSTSSGKSKLPVDENRLIQKKYPSEPATQAQFRDCTSELSTEELKLVSASHKVFIILSLASAFLSAFLGRGFWKGLCRVSVYEKLCGF
jgi:hypothetical protein